MRKSQRPVTIRVSNSGGGRSAALKSKGPRPKKEPFYLPEDEDESPRSRIKGKKKKRGKDDFIENTHEQMQAELQELLEKEGSSKKPSSKFKKSFAKFQEKLDPNNPDFRIDQASTSFYRSALDMLVDLIPIAETNFRATGREGASYALVALVKQVEELQNAIRMNDDIEGRIQTLRSLVQGVFVRLAEMVINSKFEAHKAIDNVTNDPKKRKHLRKALDDMILAMAKPMEEYKELLQMQIALYMAGDPSYLNPEAAKQQNSSPKKKKRKKVAK